jgi:hypothetical protein
MGQYINHFPHNSPRGTEYACNSSATHGKIIFAGSSLLYGHVLQHFMCFSVVIPQRLAHDAQSKAVGSNNAMPSVQSMLQGQGFITSLAAFRVTRLPAHYYFTSI